MSPPLTFFATNSRRRLKLPNLDPVGEIDYEGRLTHAFTAHPKIDARTGELITYGYSVMTKPYCSVSLINREGELVHTTDVDIPKPVMMHDCAITSNHTVIMDLPAVFDFARMAEGKSILNFEPVSYTHLTLPTILLV